jgi:regulator of sigma E protease
VVAGVVMNTILAVLIFYVFMFISGFRAELPLIGNPHFFFANQQRTSDIYVVEVAKNSPAEKAKITPFSRIVFVNGKKIVSSQQFSNLIRENKGKEITMEWEDYQSKKHYQATLTPRVNPPKGEGALGVVFAPQETVILTYDTPVQKTFSGIIHPANLMAYNFTAMASLIDLSVKEKNVAPISQGVSGPIGIFSYVGLIINQPDYQKRVLDLLNLAGLLSISLAFFNVLPIPGLDGGRLFFIIIEAIIGRKVNQKVEGYAHAVGMVVLMGLILLVSIKDISQLKAVNDFFGQFFK